ncbi:extensin family protein [Jannaschia pohangensis]|uniref:Uncharacterized conserved protein n=1 Tax=Jannaschia pohangensis TaxID=390807 RepID=A0A1I3QL86_9RHOB|nr:extensin family protein [Jannaschia pohangensis]SFJ34873.1 Uncharacterized conserved protein [Jannaschia pohangensis]
MMRALALLLAACLAGPVAADIRPMPRPTPDIVIMSSRGTTELPDSTTPDASVRPVVRRTEADRQALRVAAALRAPEPVIDALGFVRLSDRPLSRPADLITVAAGRPRPDRGGGGGLCGRSSIQGASIPTVTGAGACGIPDPVRITRVSGVDLIQPARMDCGTAQALDDWVRTGLLPTVGNTGGGAVALRVAAGYACRGRNNQSGAKLSEHAKGRAIDISAIQLANGSRITVLTDWGQGRNGQILRALWQAACGPFGTVLGPESDRYHRDHFHFDTARYRSGSYCR